MPLIPRDFDDLLLDRIVSTLEAFSAEQAQIDPAVAFSVVRSRRRSVSPKEAPLVNVWSDSCIPSQAGGTARTIGSETVTINVDCIAHEDTDDLARDSDEAVDLRLAYLKAQVRHALFALSASDFGLPVGTIAAKTWPTWTPYKDESGQLEESIIGGRWTFNVSYNWRPVESDHPAFTGVSIDTGLWSGLYSYAKGIAISGHAEASAT
jgi:hypothetical protein